MAVSTLHAWLEFADAQTGSPRRVDLDHNTLSIGKTGGDLTLVDSAMAGIHAIITREEGDSFIIRDLSGGAGTFVNDRPVVEAQLVNLDRIRLGNTHFVFNAAYLDPEVYAARYGLRKHEAAEDLAPGHQPEKGGGSPHRLLSTPAMLGHPLRFWPDALETSVFHLKRTWLTHLMIAVLILVGALTTSEGVPFLHLGFLTFAAAVSLVLVAITCSVFFAFDSLHDAPQRLGQALRFTFHVAPLALAAQVVFLMWAWRAHPRTDLFFLAAAAPTGAFCWSFAAQGRHAFGVGAGRALAFAITASVPWNLFMTGLMAFIV